MQNLVTVFGGSGFIGTQVVRQLAKAGWRIRVAVRNPNLGYAMRLHGDVGQIDVIQANIRNEASVRRAVEGATAVVNLVGVLFEQGRQGFQAVHVMGARNVAEAARDAGVTQLIQMSALGADINSPSKYARSKAEAEAAVRDAFPGAVIVRPSVVFGQDDGFFNKFAQMAALSPVLPLIGGGRTRFQPVFVGDVAKAIARMTTDPAAAGETYELGGPADFSFRRLMEIVLEETGRRRMLLPIPFGAAGALGAVGDIVAMVLPPPITSDQLELLKTDNVVSGAYLGLADLGVTPTTLESVLPTYLYRYRRGGQYADQEARAVAGGQA
ncbi:complex I NDUFA9 subunit family protein [Phenylobacterium deserti]|uniref:Complex I NDUFA9 subunit family protein n=1 Tax=Phenylobacterium deserti TaxID=1914756 RepID=A0A328AU67_9CAUL|nr:complex I NDUFA9 subunit family protein [Phenylobacterium deserti]RAK57074.1 complex I NDUFA9 subunit family protein [Phenylobacterium deserti]